MVIPPQLALFAARHSASLIKVGLFILLLGGAYVLGRHDMKLKYAEQETKDAQKAEAAIKVEMGLRLEIAELKSKNRAQLDQNIREGKRNYGKAVDKAGSKPMCNLSPDELLYLKQIGKP